MFQQKLLSQTLLAAAIVGSMALTGCSKPAEKAAFEAKAPAASGDTIKVGILPIKSGQILLDGKDISKLSPEH